MNCLLFVLYNILSLSDTLNTVLSLVQDSFVFILSTSQDFLSTVLSSVQYCPQYSIGFSTVLASVQYNLQYSTVFSTVQSSVQYCPQYSCYVPSVGFAARQRYDCLLLSRGSCEGSWT